MQPFPPMALPFLPMSVSAPVHPVRTLGSEGLGSHTITLKDLLDAKLLCTNDMLIFKNETAILNEYGNLVYKGKEFTSPSNWAKAVAASIGLSKHYNGWKVVERDGRPLEQFRDKYFATIHGLHYEFPPTNLRRRKRQPSPPGASPAESSALLEPPSKRVDTGATKLEPASTDTINLALSEPLSSSSAGSQSDDEASTQQPQPQNGTEERVVFAPGACGHPKCQLCMPKKNIHSQQHSTWSDILQVVLSSLEKMHPEKSYFALSDDIYAFIDYHWKHLCSKPRSPAWRQTCKMTLAHSRYSHLFENGYEKLLKTGFWRLKASGHVSLGTDGAAGSAGSASPVESEPGTALDQSSALATTEADSSSDSDQPLKNQSESTSGSYNLRRRGGGGAHGALQSLIDGMLDENDDNDAASEESSSNDDAQRRRPRPCSSCRRTVFNGAGTTSDDGSFVCNMCTTRQSRYGRRLGPVVFDTAVSGPMTRAEEVSQCLMRLHNDLTLDWNDDVDMIPADWVPPTRPIRSYKPREMTQLTQEEREEILALRSRSPPVESEEMKQLRLENEKLALQLSEERLIRLRSLSMARAAIDEAEIAKVQEFIMWDDIDSLKRQCVALETQNKAAETYFQQLDAQLSALREANQPVQALKDKIATSEQEGSDVEKKILELETELVLERQRAAALEAQVKQAVASNKDAKAYVAQQTQMAAAAASMQAYMATPQMFAAPMRYYAMAPPGAVVAAAASAQPGAKTPESYYRMQPGVPGPMWM